MILDVLAARWRTGETLWTFPSRLRPAVRALAELGLVHEMHGVTEGTIRARLTEAGKAAVLLDSYENPADEAHRLLVDVLRRSTGHVDGRMLMWPAELGEEPSWFAAQAILADSVLAAPFLAARDGLNEETITP